MQNALLCKPANIMFYYASETCPPVFKLACQLVCCRHSVLLVCMLACLQAVPDTKLTIKKYEDAKFEFLVSNSVLKKNL